MSRKTGFLIGATAFLAFIGLLTYGMFSLRRNSVEVCIVWNGRSECAKAAGTTQQEAIRTATDKACALLSGGMTDSMNCSHTTPAKVTWLD